MFSEIIKRIKPTVEEEKKLQTKVEEILKKINKDEKAVVGGSFAKGTWLSGTHDIDIFVVFEDEKNISNKLERILKKNFRKIERIHGSRDYFIVKEEKLNIEFIPVVKIKKAEEAKNVTDVSLLHVDWVKKKLTPKLADDVRLAKKFFRAQKVYGAETYIQGFSGYVVEILVIYYGSFLEFLKHALHWKRGILIDPSAHGKEMEKHKGNALIVIDPVQASRNAAAAVSEERFNRLVKECRSFVQKPTEKSFEEKSPELKDLERYDLIIEAEPLEGKADVVGTKMVKAFEEIEKRLKEEGFKVKEKDWDWTKRAYFWLNVEKKVVEKKYKHFGPPLKMKEFVEQFKKKYKKMKILEEKGQVYVLKERKYPNVKDALKGIIKEKEVKKRVKKIKVLKA